MPDLPLPPAPSLETEVPQDRGSWAVLAAATAFGILADQVADGPPGIGFALVAVAAVAGIALFGKPRASAAPFFLSGLIVMAFVSIRASSILQAANTAAAVCLFAIGAGFSRGGSPRVATIRSYLARGVAVVGGLPEGVASLSRPLGRWKAGSRVHSVPLTAAVVLPVLALFMVLLGTADPVFGRLLTYPLGDLNASSISAHLVGIGGGAVAFSTLLARSRRGLELGFVEAEVLAPVALREVGWSALLICVNVLFAAFLAVQFAYFFGGRDRVMAQEGLTFAEYARKGFWQLLAAAILTGALIAYAWVVGGRDATGARRRAFTCLAGGLIVMTLAVLVSAFQRLTLYESAYGYTWLRLLVHEAIIVVGVLLVCGLVAIAWRRVSWLPAAAVSVGVIALLVLNVLNPDASIARRNIERYVATGELDQGVIQALSPDAVPTLVELLPSLRGCAKAGVAFRLKSEADMTSSSTGASWNLGRIRAAAALESVDLAELHTGCG